MYKVHLLFGGQGQEAKSG